MANDAALRANFDDFLYDLQGTLQRLFARDNVFLAELSGAIIDRNTGVVEYDSNYQRYTRAMDGNREHFEGEQVRFPILTAALQGGSMGSETTTWNNPIPMTTAKATVKLGQVIQPLAISLALERDSKGGSHSAMSAVELYTTEAYGAVSTIEDETFFRSGNAQLAVNTGTDTTGLVVTVGTSADWDVLNPGKIVDVLQSSDGTDQGQGLRRLIASVDTAAGTVTFSTTQQAGDGGSGNLTLTGKTVGLYVAGSYGNALQGLAQTVTTGGTAFEGIDKNNVARWTATDFDASAAGLSDSLLQQATYKARQNGVGFHDFGIGHWAVIDKYIASKTPTVYYQPQEATLRSGFSGIVYQGADKPYPLVKSMHCPRKTAWLIRKDALRLYGDDVGPAFIDDDGGMFRFFARKTVKEADLLDRVQLAVARPNSLVRIKNLAEQY